MDEQINSIYVDHRLAEMLLLQESNGFDLESNRIRQNNIPQKETIRNNPLNTNRKNKMYEHSFDLMKRLEQNESIDEKNGSVFLQQQMLKQIKDRPSYNDATYINIEQQDRIQMCTPNPFYHHQKKKLILKYQKQLLEQELED